LSESLSVSAHLRKNLRINKHVFGVTLTNLTLNAQLCDETHSCSLTLFGPQYQILSQLEEKFRTLGENFMCSPV